MTLYLQGKRVNGMDCVLRNSQGTFLGCFGNTMLGVLSAKDEGKLWALRMGFSSVTFELVAKIIVDAFYSTKPDDSEFGIVV